MGAQAPPTVPEQLSDLFILWAGPSHCEPASDLLELS